MYFLVPFPHHFADI